MESTGTQSLSKAIEEELKMFYGYCSMGCSSVFRLTAGKA